jgi:hypothetical protein
MKRFLLLAALGAVVSIAVIGAAQSPDASPAPAPAAISSGAAGGNPGAAASSVPLPAQPSGPNLEQSMPLMPENVPPGTESGGGGRKSGKHKGGIPGPWSKPSPSGSPRETFAVEADIRIRLKMRAAETQALNEPQTQADWVAAHQTRTDPARRAALTVYYNHLYDRMIQIDPTIATAVNARRLGELGRLHYARLGDLLPADNPYATPVPPAQGVNPPTSDEPPPPL